nr:SRPBCC family protein [Saprospiraceae bacterium]
MMKVVKIILYVLIALFAVLVLLVLIAPTQYHVEREATIEAEKTLVYDQMVPFENFHQWSPWRDVDPDAEITIEGTQGEVGSKYSWSGNEEAGKGSLEITRISGDTVFFDLVFIEPWESTAKTYYIIEDHGEETRVVWGMHSAMPRPFNVIGWFMGLESSIGEDYEKGLEYLRDHVKEVEILEKESRAELPTEGELVDEAEEMYDDQEEEDMNQ